MIWKISFEMVEVKKSFLIELGDVGIVYRVEHLVSGATSLNQPDIAQPG